MAIMDSNPGGAAVETAVEAAVETAVDTAVETGVGETLIEEVSIDGMCGVY
jgi:mycofactocin precursor